MSDQLIVEREGLAKKEKAELQAIVEALGGTKSSRARKADLIDQILELSGVTSGGSSVPNTGKVAGPDRSERSTAVGLTDLAAGSTGDGPVDKTADSTAGAEPNVPVDADPSGSPDVTGSSRSTTYPTGADGEPLADWEVEMLDTDDKSGSGRPRRQRGRANGSKARDGEEMKGRNGDGSRGRNSGSGNDGPAGSQDDKADGGRAKGGRRKGGSDAKAVGRNADANSDHKAKDDGGDDEDDATNKKSRRRSRNRKSDRDDAPSDPITNEPIEVEGYLDLRDEGYAFLRVNGFLPSREDAYVSVKQVRQHGLRKGDHVTGLSRAANRNEKNPALQQLLTINGADPDDARDRPKFDKLTPLYPDEQLILERSGDPEALSPRIIDLLAPIGKGQRGLIVSPPQAGKTELIKDLARSIETNHPEVELIVLLIDERPEEVTDVARHLERGEVVASSFDRPPEEHAAVAELTVERAKRRVENGADVCLLVDGITRLARAYNVVAPATGRVLAGGVDVAAIYPPKRFMGAARKVEEGGSLTILSTMLLDTGSEMDAVLYEEFKGTGNTQIRLDRKMAERGLFPAIDLQNTWTRRDTYRDVETIERVAKLRNELADLPEPDSGAGVNEAGVAALVERLRATASNSELLAQLG